MKLTLIYVNYIITFQFCHSFFFQSANDLLIQLNAPKGKIQGHTMKSLLGKKYYGYHEIPYAAPPIGELRFAVSNELN